MGYVRHHAIIVTGGDWGASPNGRIKKAHDKAMDLCGPHRVSPVGPKVMNGYQSFAVFPDGSKEGWEESDQGDKGREMLLRWLDAQRYEDGSSPFAWVEVQYGDDNGKTEVTAHSDEIFRTASSLGGASVDG